VTMLIFQDTILSLVAAVQISSDGRVRIGDWIEMPGQNADGDVIDIALHTITVKNWDKTVTRVPTKYLISESFKNWRGMTETGARRIKRSLYIDQRSVRFLEPDEVARFQRFMLLDDYLDAKEKELQEWNAKLAGRGAEPVNQRRVTNLGTPGAAARRGEARAARGAGRGRRGAAPPAGGGGRRTGAGACGAGAAGGAAGGAGGGGGRGGEAAGGGRCRRRPEHRPSVRT